MPDQIVYLMSGPAHLHYLIPSLATLRNHWDGDVSVYAFPESYELVKTIAEDSRLGITPKTVETPLRFRRGKNEQFINKIKLLQNVNADAVLYLDADTTIHGSLQPLLDKAKEVGFVATQFNHWVSTGRIIRNRLQRLQGIEKICQESLFAVMNNVFPSVNGGIVACQPSSPVLPLWLDWSLASKDVFICDEAVLHVLQHYVPKEEFFVMEGGKFNCSHKYDETDGGEIVVYHYHGDSNVRPDKSPKAYAYWWPLYEQCIEENFGNIQSWIGSVRNDWIEKLNQREESND